MALFVRLFFRALWRDHLLNADKSVLVKACANAAPACESDRLCVLLANMSWLDHSSRNATRALFVGWLVQMSQTV